MIFLLGEIPGGRSPPVLGRAATVQDSHRSIKEIPQIVMTGTKNRNIVDPPTEKEVVVIQRAIHLQVHLAALAVTENPTTVA